MLIALVFAFSDSIPLSKFLGSSQTAQRDVSGQTFQAEVIRKVTNPRRESSAKSSVEMVEYRSVLKFIGAKIREEATVSRKRNGKLEWSKRFLATDNGRTLTVSQLEGSDGLGAVILYDSSSVSGSSAPDVVLPIWRIARPFELCRDTTFVLGRDRSRFSYFFEQAGTSIDPIGTVEKSKPSRWMAKSSGGSAASVDLLSPPSGGTLISAEFGLDGNRFCEFTVQWQEKCGMRVPAKVVARFPAGAEGTAPLTIETTVKDLASIPTHDANCFETPIGQGVVVKDRRRAKSGG